MLGTHLNTNAGHKTNMLTNRQIGRLRRFLFTDSPSRWNAFVRHSSLADTEMSEA